MNFYIKATHNIKQNKKWAVNKNENYKNNQSKLKAT